MKANILQQSKWAVQFTISLIISASTFAQTYTTKTINLDEVVVIGTKAAVNRNNVPLTVSAISNQKIESSSE